MTNFKDDVSLVRLLGCINTTFQELKRHEEIENTCIMEELQHRLINEQILAVVSDVHKDCHVLEILSLTRKGLKSASKNRTSLNRNTFEDRLREALESFQKDFLPHMRHEEEVNNLFPSTVSLLRVNTWSQQHCRQFKCSYLPLSNFPLSSHLQ